MSDLLALVRSIVAGDMKAVERQLRDDPALAIAASLDGATKHGSADYFFPDIAHFLYRGDTALHMAAAAFQQPIAERLIALGADCHARNRRGAQPLHYAAETNHWGPVAQADTIAFLLSAGVNPDAVDNDGVAPLHRAVRTRSAAAVSALLRGGANPRLVNGRGSTPMDLANRTTGRGGSGSDRARTQQVLIVKLLEDSVPV